MYIPVVNFSGWGEDAVAAAGTGVFAEIGDSGLTGLLCTNNDLVYHTMLFPSMWDITKEIGVRVIWSATAETTAADAVKWEIKYDVDAENAEIADPATALDTALTLQTLTAAQAVDQGYFRSSRGIIVANKFSIADLEKMFTFYVKMVTQTTIGNDEAAVIGVVWDYYPHLTVSGQNVDETSRAVFASTGSA